MPPATQVQGDCIGEARLDENTNGTPVLAKLGHFKWPFILGNKLSITTVTLSY